MGGFLLHGNQLSTILIFIFPKAWVCFFPSVSFPTLSLHFLQHRLLDWASSLVGIAAPCLVGGFVVRWNVGGVLPSTAAGPNSCIVGPPAMRGTPTYVAAARPWAPLGLSLMLPPPSLVRFGMGMVLLRMTAMLSRRWTGGHCGMGSICWACFLLFHMAATASIATVASFTVTVTNDSLTVSLRWVMMQGNFDTPIFPGRRGGGGRGAGR